MMIRERSILQRKRWDADPVYWERTSAIVAEVRARGDVAVREYTQRFDHVNPASFRVEDCRSAYAHVAPEVVEALRLAAERVEQFHRRQPFTSWMMHTLG